MIRLCNIVPVSYLGITDTQKTHWISTRMAENNTEYREFYKLLKEAYPNYHCYLDARDADGSMQEVINLANDLNVDTVVIPNSSEYLVSVNESLAKKWFPALKLANLRTMFIPKAAFNDSLGFFKSFSWALNDKSVDMIGVSTDYCATAFGVEDESNIELETPFIDTTYPMQRYLSRWHLFNALGQLKLLNNMNSHKKFHCLDLNGVREIELLSSFHKFIFSWHTSEPFWLAYNKAMYDSSPTSLRHGGVNTTFDYMAPYIDDVEINKGITHNIGFAEASAE